MLGLFLHIINKKAFRHLKLEITKSLKRQDLTSMAMEKLLTKQNNSKLRGWALDASYRPKLKGQIVWTLTEKISAGN